MSRLVEAEERQVPSVRRLRELLDHISAAGRASRFEVLRLLPLARELAEAKGQLAEFQTLRLFADWTLHSKLDRAAARQLLERIAEVVSRHRSDDPRRIVEGISQTLSIAALRHELLTLFGGHSLPMFLFDLPEPWTQCASWMLQDLMEKPVIGSPFTKEELRTGWGETPRVLRLSADSKPGSDICWCVELGPKVHLTGKLLRA